MNIGEPASHERHPPLAVEQTELEDEARRIRRLQVMMSMVSSVISQDSSLTVEEWKKPQNLPQAPSVLPLQCFPTKN